MRLTPNAHAVGDHLTVRCDHQFLGSITDGRVSQPGIVRLEAEGEGYFRDIVYVPLDDADGAPATAD